MNTTTTQIIKMFGFLSLLIAFTACGAGDDGSNDINSEGANTETGLTEFEMEHGIGPVTEKIELGDIDPAKVDEGRNIFEMKCEACHNMEGRMVGPALGDVMDRRSAEFVMNFILNPFGMTREHPVGKELLQEYMTPMPFQNVSEDEARAIVEFLRDYAEN